MKVVCINNITDDPDVYAAFYKKDMFQKLDDWRDKKLNELGI
jgi:hypothetical protein